ncbi:protein kinase [Sedimentitalea sp.]|uniref:protein kinase domain-containing protein n=1 Tax=Sedimentitalea sp. TaxID=2048915 RepID=UPI00329802B7
MCEIKRLDEDIVVGKRRISLPGLKFMTAIGSGANGVVFQAHDIELNRPIAVKFWNSRGRSRSQEEISKLARLSHPLFVSVHRFHFEEQVPIATMELVAGVSGKEWIRSNPAFDDRLEVWWRYSTAISDLHTMGMQHGDPHLGNVLIFDDELGVQRAFDKTNDRPSKIRVKLADIGTSVFWRSHQDFEDREKKLIIETGAKLLGSRPIDLVAIGASD